MVKLLLQGGPPTRDYPNQSFYFGRLKKPASKIDSGLLLNHFELCLVPAKRLINYIYCIRFSLNKTRRTVQTQTMAVIAFEPADKATFV